MKRDGWVNNKPLALNISDSNKIAWPGEHLANGDMGEMPIGGFSVVFGPLQKRHCSLWKS